MSEQTEFYYGSTQKSWKSGRRRKRGQSQGLIRPIDLRRAGGDRILAKGESFQYSRNGKSRSIVSNGTAPTRTAASRFAAIGRQTNPKAAKPKRITRRG